MHSKSTILIVDDDEMARASLREELERNYIVLDAYNGIQALKLLQEYEIAAIVLDLIMPGMDGIAFLEEFNKKQEYKKIPVIVATSNDDEVMEQRCLELGVWDFVMKPYKASLLEFRIKNVIDKSRMIIAERDSVTKIYTKTKFYQATRQMLTEHNKESFAFLRIDIDRFKMINNFYGVQEGDKVLIAIAQELKKISGMFEWFCYGRLDNDVFACCIPYKKENVELLVQALQIRLKQLNKDYNIKISCGVYVIDDYNMDISEMYDRAFMAAKNCKGQFIENIAYYDDSMIENMRQEQFIINDVNKALAEEQFVVFLQPKINLQTEQPYGAEALIRWRHPEKGMIMPGDFIPIYERNGIIGRLDQYMWRQVCALLRRWLDEGLEPDPISVNVSRVNLYNPHLVDILKNLITEYRIPAALLNLELTESAFMEDQQLIMGTMSKLHKLGFKIMMDDFGSGFSSLNILKDMELDYLKIDMKFLDAQGFNGRGEKVLTSVIRMAKWLQLPAIVEGVETIEQVDFLKCVGCEYAQGYYFAKPMSVFEYEKYIHKSKKQISKEISNTHANMVSELWNVNSNVSILFDSIGVPMAVFEYCKGSVELLRSNAAFDATFREEQICSAKEKESKVQKECRMLAHAIKKARSYHEVQVVTMEKCGKRYRLVVNVLGNKSNSQIFVVTYIEE